MMHWYILAILALWASYTDLSRHKLPNKLTAGGTILGFAVHAGQNGWNGLIEAAEGTAAGFGIMLVLYVLRAVGAGDVKFFAAVGSLGGAAFAVSSVTYSICYAGLIGLMILAFRKILAARLLPVWNALAGLFLLSDPDPLRSLWKRKDLIRFPLMLAALPALATAMLERFGS